MVAERGARRARRPLLACALALLAGSLAGASHPGTSLAWCAGAGAAAGFLLGARRRAPAAVLTGVALGLLALLQAARSAAVAIPPERWRPRPVEGRWEALALDTDAVRGRLVGAPPGTPVFALPRGSVRTGERVRLSPSRGRAEAARGPVPARGRRPGSVRLHPDELERLAPPRAGLASLRGRLARRCDELGDERVAALARALLLGDRSRLDPATADLFTRTGVRHLLAVSGLHVGLFTALLAGPLAWLLAHLARGSRARRRDLARALAALGVLVFAPLAGGAPPVRRAALAVAVALLAPLVPCRGGNGAGRALDGLSAWSAALLVELLVDPLAAGLVGVQLSYAATLGLVVSARALDLRLRALLPVSPPLLQRSAPRLWSTTCVRRVTGWLRMALAASCAATLATLPIVWSSFGEWSPAGAVLTPAALVLLAWCLPAGWLSLLAPGELGPLLLAPATHALQGLISLADRLPGTPCALPERPLALLLPAGALTLVALAATAWPVAANALRRAAALVWAVLLVPWSPAPAGLELVALDVGHGTAVALRAPGAGVWIFDAGSRDRTGVGPAALAALLARWDPARVAVVLSHDQTDHASGLAWVVERRPPWVWAGALPALLAERLPHRCLRVDGSSGSLALPVRAAGTGLELELVRGLACGGNEGSRSLLVTWEGRRALLSGDAEQEGLRELLARGALPGPLELLLAPHHGSHTPWLGPLLEATRPCEVWISGAGAPPIAGELDRRRLGWRTTDREGPLVVRWHANR